MTSDQTTLEAGQLPPSEPVAVPQANQFLRVTSRADRTASSVFIMPSVLVVLFLAIFPLIISLYLSLSRFQFVKGGFKITFVGLANFRKLFLGSEKSHFLGVFGHPQCSRLDDFRQRHRLIDLCACFGASSSAGSKPAPWLPIYWCFFSSLH